LATGMVCRILDGWIVPDSAALVDVAEKLVAVVGGNVGVTGRKGGEGRRKRRSRSRSRSRSRRKRRKKARAGFVRSLCYVCVCMWMFCGTISLHRQSAPDIWSWWSWWS